ncbi:D-alanyl-D-alanine carboxypeptidase/D-alanyl-D-alanine-endopeptidase [Shewanella submarina]|uniref:D-alanyl-D-alanine carboxypeptidase/D-alanyl-D-alanine-endopeptidase n=1 Tax=Shewanella submarina TaxID=2016376 RepID=A0ABV7GIK5_9GAMM|nr:D-alanyl-D-alanine carboxypeptidase/D-alanyl-D-alanine-endopeptidase [Shewanella submarina]MCL1037952.1 D-alanyl-D-alanine carboxypeptidase/D-alanyl-D-alanine-endopeptidase [Shewanella submarina]
MMVLKQRIAALALGISLGMTYAHGGQISTDDSLQHWVEGKLPQNTNVSFILQKTNDSAPLVSINPAHRMLPASVLKLMTAAAATSLLGPEYRYTTRLLTDDKVIDGTLSGNLYLEFSGDPSLSSANLASLMSKLEAKGIKQIQGDLVLVGNLNQKTKATGWVWDDLGICYAAPVSSFIIDKNCVKGVMQPVSGSNKARVSLRQDAPFSLVADTFYDEDQPQEFCSLSLNSKGSNQVSIEGCFPKRKAINLAFAVADSRQFAADWATRILNRQQIPVLGTLRFASSLPSTSMTLATLESPALSELTGELLLESDNLITDSLLLAMGRKVYGQNADFPQGVAALKQTLLTMGVDLQGSRLVDGSGLSRYNLVSAAQLHKLLNHIYQTPSLKPLLDTLPIAGATGTLQYKFPYNQTPLKLKVLGKTGSMGGVDNLVGIIKLEGQEYLFVALENGLVSTPQTPNPVPWHGRLLKELLPLLEQTSSQTAKQ